MRLEIHRHRGIAALLVACALVAACAGGPPGADRSGWSIEHELLPHRSDPGKHVEVFLARPDGTGPWPAVLLVHGHQEQARDGGAMYARTGRLGVLARRGYVAVAVSQPGYGRSDGPPDFCGPFTQEAAETVLAWLRARPFVVPGKIALFGYSRGAIVAAMVATRDPGLGAVILGAGAYDFSTWYPTPLPGIDANIRSEAGVSREAFGARSAIHHVDRIAAPVLLLHGAADERVPFRQAEVFAERLRAAGRSVTLKVFASGHGIPVDAQYREVFPFLEAAFR